MLLAQHALAFQTCGKGRGYEARKKRETPEEKVLHSSCSGVHQSGHNNLFSRIVVFHKTGNLCGTTSRTHLDKPDLVRLEVALLDCVLRVCA